MATSVKKYDIKCDACNGSGRYDNTGSPKCGNCSGLGVVYNGKIPYRLWKRIAIKFFNKDKSNIEAIYEERY